ncbi:hypothetical protein C7S18_00055 [Ahniella affigens]|uniref:Uncharacterized protein n=1 Tax=Ahniella affigens TaxID=2021234 RepID=A0A2P1PLG4_9GAMM|nr:hypothetical protein [Ahniella affigens]AVP95684.1 hypothetical protein C7S18_00055 [Ahniella affigens]
MDQLLELAGEDVLEKLEANASAISRWIGALVSGVEVIVRTSQNRYSEAVSPELLGRLAKFKLEVSFTYEHISSESG